MKGGKRSTSERAVEGRSIDNQRRDVFLTQQGTGIGAWLNSGQLQGAFRLAEADIVRASGVETDAKRCLTVENEAAFHELAKLQSGELLIQKSYRGYGPLKLLERLPLAMEFWHFGDSDQAGFDILRDLRERSGRDFQALHMEPGRIPHEQEALGRPSSSRWPFYNHS